MIVILCVNYRAFLWLKLCIARAFFHSFESSLISIRFLRWFALVFVDFREFLRQFSHVFFVDFRAFAIPFRLFGCFLFGCFFIWMLFLLFLDAFSSLILISKIFFVDFYEFPRWFSLEHFVDSFPCVRVLSRWGVRFFFIHFREALRLISHVVSVDFSSFLRGLSHVSLNWFVRTFVVEVLVWFLFYRVSSLIFFTYSPLVFTRFDDNLMRFLPWFASFFGRFFSWNFAKLFADFRTPSSNLFIDFHTFAFFPRWFT